MRIAVASSDGKCVDLHLGKANSLYVYDWSSEEDVIFVEHREIAIDEDAKHQNSEVLSACSDCDVLISTKYGFKAKIKAEDLGIKLVVDNVSVSKAINNYIEHYNFMNS